MDNRSVVALGAVMLVVTMGFAFYWYEYRPSRIRSACEARSTEQAQAFLREMAGKQAPKGPPDGFYIRSDKEAYYVSCVREQGLER